MKETGSRAKTNASADAKSTLANATPGSEVRVVGFEEVPSAEQTHLQAFGLAPGRWAHVIQHYPVTIVVVENTELALEADIARRILIADARMHDEELTPGRKRTMRRARQHRRQGPRGRARRRAKGAGGSEP